MKPGDSKRAVNILLMVVVIFQLANSFLMWLPQYVRLILNEALFVFLPAYLYLRLTRQPLAERVRWRWPGWPVALLSLLIGLGLYPAAVAGSQVLMRVLGYARFATPQDTVPMTPLMAVLAVIAFSVMAPLCEEFLFRGVIQPVYERRGPARAVAFTGLLFVVFHLALVQGLSIIPLALALGFVNYRARSLPASILTHVGANFPASLVIIARVFPTGIEKWVFTTAAVVGGLALAAVGLALLVRLTPRQAEAQPAAPVEAASVEAAPVELARRSWLAESWPLLVVAFLFLVAAGSEFYVFRTPHLLAGPLEVRAVPWQAGESWEYEIRNAAGDVVGEAVCRVGPRGQEVELVCESRTEAYEVQVGKSYYQSSGGERTDTLRWRPDGGQLVSGAIDLRNVTGYTTETLWALGAETVDVQVSVDGEVEQSSSVPLSEALPPGQEGLPVVQGYTFAWQLAGMPLEEGAAGNVLVLEPSTWRQATQDFGPALETKLVSVAGAEEIETPAGVFTAWKATLGLERTTWYAVVDGSPLPVMFFNGAETWALK